MKVLPTYAKVFLVLLTVDFSSNVSSRRLARFKAHLELVS